MSDSPNVVPTTITFPPTTTISKIYVAGSFNKWEVVEMDVAPNDLTTPTTYTHSKILELKPGTYQYKFRLGEGQWWVCDESNPKVMDDAGNVNNILTVSESEEDQGVADEEQTQEDTVPAQANLTTAPPAASAGVVETVESASQPSPQISTLRPAEISDGPDHIVPTNVPTKLEPPLAFAQNGKPKSGKHQGSGHTTPSWFARFFARGTNNVALAAVIVSIPVAIAWAISR